MDKTKTIIYILIIIGSLCCGFIVSYGTNSANPQNPEIHAYFDKVCDAPYKVTYGPYPETLFTNGGDCDDRARTFKKYLENMGATNIRLVWVWREENNTIQWGYGMHEVLVWNNHVYNPTHNKKLVFYDYSINSAEKVFSEKYGYNRWKYLDNNVTYSF